MPFACHFLRLVCLGGLVIPALSRIAVSAAAETLPAVTGTIDPRRTVDTSTRLEANGAMRCGVRYLLARQLPDGSWGVNPAVTSLAALALLDSSEHDTPDVTSAAARGVRFIVRHVPYQAAGDRSTAAASGYPVLASAVGVLAVLRLARPEDQVYVESTRHYLFAAQCLDVPPEDPRYGGFSASPGRQPDLATTDYVLEALYLSDARHRGQERAGADERADQAYRAAADFVSRCQLRSARQDDPDYGRFAAIPPDTADSRAQPPRSPGYLTCTGLKSLLYSRVPAEDARVRAAGAWLERHFSLQRNPGSENNAGYFTYLHALGRTLHVWERASRSAAPPFRPAWRRSLVEELLSRQRSDGSWQHGSTDWWENRPELTTAYALLTLEQALQ